MPVLATAFPVNKTVQDVFDRARSVLNDTGGTWPPTPVFWVNARLTGFIKDAYTWMYNQLAINFDLPFEKLFTDIVYTAPANPGNEQDLSSLMPTDLLAPLALEFRLNTSEDYVPVDRKDSLPSRVNSIPERVVDWEYRGRTIIVNGANQNGLLRLRYLSLLPDFTALPNATTDPILADNVVEALGYYTAAMAYRSRGQHAQATAALGSAQDPQPFGAFGYMEQLLKILTMQSQRVARRGRRFTQTGTDIGGIGLSRSDV